MVRWTAAVLIASATPAASQAPAPAHVHASFADLFYPEAVEAQQKACTKRFPASADAWQAARAGWQRAHRVPLADLHVLQDEVAQQIRAAIAANQHAFDLAAALVGSRAQAVAASVQASDVMPPAAAEMACQGWLAHLTDEQAVRGAMAAARLAGAVALSMCRTPP